MTKWKFVGAIVLIIIAVLSLEKLFLSKKINIINPVSIIKRIKYNKKYSAVSDIPKYQLKFINNDSLNDSLDKWGFWKNGITLRNGNKQTELTPQFPKTVSFHLTNQIQKNDIFAKNPKEPTTINASSGETIDTQGNLTIYIYFSPKYLALSLKNNNFNESFSYMAYRALWQLSHPTETLDQKKATELWKTTIDNKIIEIQKQ